MVNTKEFISRIKEILDYYELSSSGFAEKLGVQRATISHLVSGRNKPSLDFILKVISSFPEVNLYWLLNGKGTFPEDISVEKKAPKMEDLKIDSPSPLSQNLFSEASDVKTEGNNFQSEIIQKEKSSQNEFVIQNSKKSISKIIVLYQDGSFDSFEN